MTTTLNKQVVQYGIDGITDMLSGGGRCDPDDLHHILYNEDYFIVGTYDAKQFLEQYGVFDAISKVRDYETDSFGEVYTDYSDPEKLANMLAYIEGYKALNNCDTFNRGYGEGELSEDDLIAIRKELEGQLCP